MLVQDQSGLQRQVRAQGGVLKIAAFGNPEVTKPPTEKPQFGNHYTRSVLVFLMVLKALLYSYALRAMSEGDEIGRATKHCHQLSLVCTSGNPMVTLFLGDY